MEASKSYKSPYYDELDAAAEQKFGLPAGLQAAIRTRGERSNADQVSEAGAATVYQIIPATRDAALKKWGVDAYISPENAAEVAARLLKESIERNRGDVAKAVAEYHGGTDPKNWGPVTKAYVRRVTGSTFDRVTGATQTAAPSVARAFAAYQAGKMNPAEAAEFESDVAAGRVLLPRGATMKGAPPSADTIDANAPAEAPAGVIAAYQGGKMTADERKEFESDVAAGRIKAPPGLMAPGAPGVLDRITDVVTGTQRATLDTDTMPDWVRMPELNSFSTASAKAGLGTLFAGPDEAVKVIQAQFPGVQTRKDEKGNWLLKSSIDGNEYAIKPGFTWGDIPRAIGAIAAFTPAGRATSIAGAAAAGGATQYAIESTQQMTGGDFNPGEIALAGAGGAAVPAVKAAAGRVMQSIRGPSPAAAAVDAVIPPNAAQQAEARAMGAAPDAPPPATAPVSAPVAAVVPDAPPPVAPVAAAVPEGAPAPRPVETVPVGEAPPAPVAPDMTIPTATPNPAPAVVQNAEELAKTARNAAGGSKQATATLAEQTMPDAEAVAAAKRLGIEGHLQPDHITTNQAYRELAQAVKSVPGSQTRAAELEGLTAVAKRADDVITELGGSQDLSAVSANVRARLQAEYDALKAAAKKIYGEIDAAIPPTTPAPATDVLALVAKRAQDMGGVKNLSAAERDLFGKLTPGADGRAPTYALLDQVRKDIGAAKRGTDNVFKSADNALLGQIERALQKDQGRIAEAMGVGPQWNQARATVTMYKGIQDDLTALFGKTLQGSIVPDMAAATIQLAKGDNSRLIALLKAVPKDMRQEVAASGLASAFAHQSRSGGLSFPGYVKWFEGLQKNSQARAALFSNLPPEAVQRLKDLYTVSKGVSAATRERITTGRIMAVSEELRNADSLMGRVYDVAKRSASGLAAEMVTAPLGMPGAGLAAGIASALTRGKPNAMKAADALINSPEFRAAARNSTKTNITRLAQSGKFTAFVRASKNPGELSSREKWIAQSLQAKKDGKK